MNNNTKMFDNAFLTTGEGSQDISYDLRVNWDCTIWLEQNSILRGFIVVARTLWM